MLGPGPHPLAAGLPEPWAVEWGSDPFGPFMSFAVSDAVQRLRWVPPGTFLMGSPEGEAGRFDWEGPQHEVTLQRGLWLADTPVTQALWQAVMGENPSRFISPDRPVGTVSWDDCHRFIARLNAAVPGLGARLPSEAEWEYACRAGTQTATWVGDLEIRGERDAPRLDSIAWYAGNCGVDFELKEGHDIAFWKEKQHEHAKGGTHPVGRKAPNPFGLFDMLGNVHEWCDDLYAEYDAAPATDPRGPPAGVGRVSRGGSWRTHARIVRAAFRFWYVHGVRNIDLGLRLARDHAPGPAAERGTRSGPIPRGAGRAGARLPGK